MATGMRAATHLRRITSSEGAARGRELERRAPASPSTWRARVERVEGDRLLVRPSGSEEIAPLAARLALLPGYAPSEGDTVIVADGDEPIVIGVLDAARSLGLTARDGARAELTPGGFDVRDAEGRLLVRYANGAAEVAPATGDLLLKAPAGSVRVEAAADVAIAAGRDAIVEGARRAELRASVPEGADLGSHVTVDARSATVAAPKLEVRARSARLVTAGADVIAQAIRTSASTIETTARKIDVTSERVTTRAKELVDEVTGLLETRAGRVRSLVKGAFSLRSRTTAMKSKDDTSIDGRRVLLG